jgi:predicted CXXCH cytochrome family protein
MKKVLLVTVLVAASAARAGPGGAVLGSKHDLSVRGPGAIRAVSETNPCVFCHVSHAGISNRPELRSVQRPYESSTLMARIGAPTGASRVCLSCHDGTIAVGETRTRRIQTTLAAIPADRRSNLGTDLRKTHPVSFRPVPSGATHPPPAADAVQLDRSGQVQCTSCHDPHVEFGDPAVGKFLVKPSQRSALCLSCHSTTAVEAAGLGHATAAVPFGAGQGNTAGWASVAEAGCMACHTPHGADPGGRLVRSSAGDEDAGCLRCHASSVTRQNIGRDLAKPSAHASIGRGVHDAAEGRSGGARNLPERSPGAPRHVSCVDCHDPHAANDRPAMGGGVSGALDGVWGIDQGGNRVEQVRFEYELCFKCHADSANKPQTFGPRPPDTVRRAVIEANLRRLFAPSAASFHPVIALGRNLEVPSLKPPWTVASLITCGDCHASDSGPGAGGGGARGSHGSIYPHLLERNYATADFSVESASSYALCYKCHDRDVLLSDRSSFPLHRRHVVERSAPCSGCHASHGVAAQAGGPDANAHLIDFDVSIVKPGFGGVRRYQAQGPGRGSCTLSCHGKDHSALTYPDPSSASSALRP